MAITGRTDTRSREMGRPRKAKQGESLNLSFRADPDLVRALDAEVDRHSAESGIKPSRTQVVMAILRRGLKLPPKTRGSE
jgi:hypothetical protein